MANSPRHPAPLPADEPRTDPFPATRWSLVVAASGRDKAVAKRALDELCGIYWFPVYGYYRGQGESPADAEDLTQDFLSSLIERGSFETVSPERGKLRAFLLVSAKHFLTSAHRKRHARKRGGGEVPIPIDGAYAEGRLALDPADPSGGPDVQFDRAWANTLFGRVREMLAHDYRKAEKEALATALLPFVEEDSRDPPYRELARTLGMSVGSLRVAVFRLRQRYRSLLRQEIADTLADPSDLDAEIGHLAALFQR